MYLLCHVWQEHVLEASVSAFHIETPESNNYVFALQAGYFWCSY